jgi:hypothetical protein
MEAKYIKIAQGVLENIRIIMMRYNDNQPIHKTSS